MIIKVGNMVRRIFLVLENSKYARLLKLKGAKTWEKLLVDDLLERDEEVVAKAQVRLVKD